MKKKYIIYEITNWSILLILFFILAGQFSSKLYAQNDVEIFPKIRGAIGIIHPIVTFSSEKTTTNFRDYYSVGMTMAINVWKNKKIGYSLELVPIIKSDDEISKVSNVIIHPGILVRLKNDFTFIGRVAFETSGRYGITPILSKVLYKHKDTNYAVSLPVALRFGNNKTAALTLGLQFAVSF